MNTFFRNLRLGALWTLLLCTLSFVGPAQADAQAPVAQAGQSLTQMSDGHWLLTGGSQASGAASQKILLFDPASGESIVSTLVLKFARTGHSATLMPDGRVLVLGGLDSQGSPVTDAEVLDFGANTTFVANLGLIPRAYHTATLLEDGRILITGGVDAKGQLVSEAELLNTADLQPEPLKAAMTAARWQHTAQFLPADAVLLSGGKDANGNMLTGSEFYDAKAEFFSVAGDAAAQLASLQGNQAPVVAASTPQDGAWNVNLNMRIVVRLSKWMQPGSLNAQTVTLSCAGNPIAASVVAAERGLLLFVTPRERLPAARDCQVAINGAQDALGLALARATIHFRTQDPSQTGSAPSAPTQGQQVVSSTSNALLSTAPATSTQAAPNDGKPGQADKPPAKPADASSVAAKGDGAAPSPEEDKPPREFRLPMFFEQNRGQNDARIKFSARGPGYRLFVSSAETVFDVLSVEPKRRPGAAAPNATDAMMQSLAHGKMAPRYPGSASEVRDEVTIKHRQLRMKLLGANPDSGIVGLDPLASKTHYLDARHPEHSLGDVPHYGKLLQAAVYPGIDKLYYGQQGLLEYDWIVKPGANPGKIAQKIDGADGLSINPNGDLIISAGKKTIVQKRPLAFQIIDGKNVPVAADYILAGTTVKIGLGVYDKTKPLTIDPVIEFTTTIDNLLISNGGGLVDMEIAGDGSLFMLTFGRSQYPTSNVVSLPGSNTLSNADNYLIKMKPGGQVVDYITVFVNYSAFNASNYYSPYSALAVVDSPSGPQPIISGVNFDVNGAPHPLVSKLTPAGDAYVFNRVLDPAGGGAVAVDASGAIYVSGWVVNNTLGGAVNEFWPTTAGISSDVGCAIVKLSPDASTIQYQALVRLPSCSQPMVKVDTSGNAYLVAVSNQVITPSNAAITGTVTPTTDSSGALNYSAFPFVVKFSPGGDAIQYASYLFTQQAGSYIPFQDVRDIGLDGTDNLYALGDWTVTKYTPIGNFVYATSFPQSTGANVGCSNPSCISSASLTVTPAGDAYSATIFMNPLVSNGVTYLRESTVVAKLNLDGTVDGTPFYMYGYPNGYKYGAAIRLDVHGGVYVAGEVGPYASTPPPSLFLSRLAYGTLLTSTPNPSQAGQSVTLDLVNLGPAASGWASFYDGGVFLGSAPVSGGSASFSVSSLSAGAHLLTANFGGSTFSANQVVKQNNYATTTSVSTAATSVTENSPIVLQVQVTSSGGITPTGTVAIMEGAVQRGAGVLDASGAVQITLPIQPKGGHDYVAAYPGDANNAPSTSTGTFITVTEVPIAVAITAPVSASTISVPAPVPVTATLTTGLQTTVKSVTYYANGTAIGQSLIAPFNVAWQLALPGTYTLTATAISDTGASYTSAPITVTAVTTPGSGYVTYFHDDITGNTIAATDASGNVVYTEQYRPYGERLTNDPASKMGQLAGNRIWFHGKAQDEATGLQYFGARYYDPAIGRFMGVDSAGVDVGNLHSFNRYAYGNNNPYRYRDPDGRDATEVKNAIKSWWKSSVEGFQSQSAADFAVSVFQTPYFGPEMEALGALNGLSAERGAAREVAEAGAAASGRTASKIEDVTHAGSKLPNRKTDVSKGEFEKNLEDAGFSKSTRKDGKVNVYEKDGAKYTTREFSKSTNGPTAEGFKDGKPTVKYRLGE